MDMEKLMNDITMMRYKANKLTREQTAVDPIMIKANKLKKIKQCQVWYVEERATDKKNSMTSKISGKKD